MLKVNMKEIPLFYMWVYCNYSGPWIFQSRWIDLTKCIYLGYAILGYKVIGVRILEFEAKTQFLYIKQKIFVFQVTKLPFDVTTPFLKTKL